MWIDSSICKIETTRLWEAAKIFFGLIHMIVFLQNLATVCSQKNCLTFVFCYFYKITYFTDHFYHHHQPEVCFGLFQHPMPFTSILILYFPNSNTRFAVVLMHNITTSFSSELITEVFLHLIVTYYKICHCSSNSGCLHFYCNTGIDKEFTHFSILSHTQYCTICNLTDTIF